MIIRMISRGTAALLILLALFIWLLFKNKSIEGFKAFNVFTIDNQKQTEFKSDFITIEQENENLIKTIENKTTLNNFNGISFVNVPYFEDFHLQDDFKAFILSFVKSLNLVDRMNNKVTFAIPLKFSNIKFTKGCKNTYYLFRCELINQSLNVPQSFDICIKVNASGGFGLLYMKRMSMSSLFSVKGTDDLNNDTLFRTKNNLFLLSPFKTSLED
jgi:hypothetical protein